jgi:hypothetical protein
MPASRESPRLGALNPAALGRRTRALSSADRGSQRETNGNLMSTFGFYPAPTACWMLITDWRHGSIAILLAIGAFAVGYAFRSGSSVVPSLPTDVLPTHPSPAIAEGEIEEGDAGGTRPARAVQRTGH